MSNLDEVLREAMIAHRAGKLEAALAGYSSVLSQRPSDARALHFLGLLLFHQGEIESGIEHVSRSLQHEPSNARAWNALGGMFMSVARRAEARQAYLRSTQVASNVAEGWYNLAICLRDEGDVDGAEAHLREAIRRQPSYFVAYEALAMLLYQLGRTAEAAILYNDWAARDPSNAKAQHMAAAASGLNVPARAPDEYVQELFDEAAHRFDANVEQLEYRAHLAVTQALITRVSSARQLLPAVLDAGCGTGLCGPPVRAHCRHLVGVDLSTRMLDQARERYCYDELIAAEITAFMRSRPGAFDAVISADTLVYFGALEEPLSAAFDALTVGGCLAFTLEALEGETLVSDAPVDHRLEVHGRYAHREGYVRASLEVAGFVIESLSHETLRRERDRDVRGYLVLARRR